MAGALWCNQYNVKVLAGLDQLVLDVEAVCEQDGCTQRHVINDLLVQIFLSQIRYQEGDQFCALYGCGGFGNAQAVFLGFLPAVAVLAQTDDDVIPTVLQVKCMGTALAAIAEDGDTGAAERLLLDVFL